MAKSRIVGVLSGVALLAGCGEGVDPSLSPSDDARQGGMSWEEFLANVYQEPDTGLFIANGDEVFNEKELREFYEQNFRDSKLIVHRSGGVDAKWSDTQKLNLTYCVSTSFGNNYNAAKNAMAAAAAAWEAAGNVKFVYKSEQDSSCNASNNNVLFDVRPVNAGGSYLARAFFPDSPRSERNILIDNTAFGNVSPWTLAGILRHEVGHTLGFRHEHTRPEAGYGCYEDSNWRALTTYDSASVMHYPHCNGSQTGDLVLTAKDVQGIQALYGAPGGGNNGGGGEEPPPAGGNTTETKSGSVSSGQSVHYGPFSVVAGTTFKVTMTGTGDPDLYVRFGAQPTTSSYNCRPYVSGASETCELTVPAGVTTAYIMVRGYSAGTYNLTITYTKPGSSSGTPVTDTKSGSVSASQNVHIGPYSVVAGTTFKVAMTGSGDPDLYVRFGAQPTTTTYDCRPYLAGASETCELTVPAGQSTAYIMVRGYSAGTYNLTINYTKP